MSESALSDVMSVADREFRTVLRTPSLLVLAAGYTVFVIGIALGGSTGGGYLPLALDLLTPVQLAVPVLAVAFGYRAILGVRERGELDVVRTYPVSPGAFVAGVYLGRATPLLVTVIAPLLAAGTVVPGQRQEEISLLAAHRTTDSPTLYFRFVFLVAVLAVLVLAVALAVSAVARSFRQALALAALIVLALAVGIDATLIAGFVGGYLPLSVVEALVALTPVSAFRGLVFATVVAPASTAGIDPGVSVPLAALGVALWTGGALAVAGWSIQR